MQNAPEAFILLSIPDASLSSAGWTENGILNLECVTVTVANPEAKDGQDRDVYLVLRLNASETVIDPARVVRRIDAPAFRTYTFAATQAEPDDLILRVKVPTSPQRSNIEVLEKVDTFENILEQYVVEFHKPPTTTPQLQPSAAVEAKQTAGLGVTSGNKDLRGHLVMINEDTGEVVGEVEDRFRIEEDPAMREKGHENDPVIIEVPDESTGQSDANALHAFARMVPPDQQNWVTKSASIVSHAISMTTNLLITTITTASSYYVANSAPSPHHSSVSTPAGSGSKSPIGSQPPPLPPRALVFLTSEKTRKGLSTVHTISGEAVKISSKTVKTIDGLIRRAMGAKDKRTKYFPQGVPAAGPSGLSNPNLLAPSKAGPPLPPRSRTPSPGPPPYGNEKSSSYFPQPEKGLGLAPALPPRGGAASPIPPSLPPRAGGSAAPGPTSAVAASIVEPPPQPRLTNKDRLLISADLILSTIDDSARRMLDTGTEEIGKVMGHKYGQEAAQSSLLMAGTARNVGLVYVDMRGIGRRALLKRTAKTFVKARMADNRPMSAVGDGPQAQAAVKR